MSDLDKKIAEAKAYILSLSNGDLRLASFIVFSLSNEFEGERAMFNTIKELDMRKSKQ